MRLYINYKKKLHSIFSFLFGNVNILYCFFTKISVFLAFAQVICSRHTHFLVNLLTCEMIPISGCSLWLAGRPVTSLSQYSPHQDAHKNLHTHHDYEIVHCVISTNYRHKSRTCVTLLLDSIGFSNLSVFCFSVSVITNVTNQVHMELFLLSLVDSTGQKGEADTVHMKPKAYKEGLILLLSLDMHSSCV